QDMPQQGHKARLPEVIPSNTTPVEDLWKSVSFIPREENFPVTSAIILPFACLHEIFFVPLQPAGVVVLRHFFFTHKIT
ncbi:hypothetical protein VPJ68_09020, partial [Parabacteroides distasonis]